MPYQNPNREKALRWLRTARVEHDWSKGEWRKAYRAAGIETIGVGGTGVAIPCEGQTEGFISLKFKAPHAPEHVWEFFYDNFDEARKRFTFIRSPHQDIEVLVRSTWRPGRISGEDDSPFYVREDLFDGRLDIVGDSWAMAPPSIVNHSLCDPGDGYCPGKGKGQYELMNDIRVGEMPDLLMTVFEAAVEATWQEPPLPKGSGY